MPSNDPIDISRRGFFRKALNTATGVSDKRSLELARLWFRPPFALREIAFLDACTKCGDCITACPPGALFALPDRYGPRAAATPAIDLITNACLLCEDWPCVSACEPAALVIPVPPVDHNVGDAVAVSSDADEIPLPPMARAAINTASCLPYSGPECGACGDICPVEGALNWDGPRPSIDPAYCVGCSLCRQACITDPKSIVLKVIAA
jgi:ferredoxin-type protein NapG